MYKYFCISDVHGYLTKIKKALYRSGYDENNENHFIVLVGDIMDRGPEQYATYKWISKLIKLKKGIMVLGNHDEWYILRKKYICEQLILELTNLWKKSNKKINLNQFIWNKRLEIVKFLKTLPFYIEWDDYVFAHASINPLLTDWRKGDQSSHMSLDSMVECTYLHMERIRAGAFKNFGKKVINGHIEAMNHRHFYKNGHFPYYKNPADHSFIDMPFIVDDIICIDGYLYHPDSTGIVYIIEKSKKEI